LVENNVVTQNQIDSLAMKQSIQIDRTEGNQLLASSAVRKQFNNLTESELSLLQRIPDWQKMSRDEIVKLFVSLLGKSRAWFYRDHSADRRKEKDSAITRLETNQLTIVEQIRVSCRMQKAFIDRCMNHRDLPDFSNSTWRRIYHDLGVGMQNEIAYVKDGPLKMRSRLAPIIRDKTFLQPLEVIVGDFWRVDLATKWVDGSLVRPSCAVWVDWRTHKIVGVALTKFPNSLGVKTSLLNCFIHHGIPRTAYIDNGKEYLAHRVVGRKIEQQMVKLDISDVENKLQVFEAKGFLPSLGINHKSALIRNPQTKVIERLFGRGGFTDYAKDFSNWIGANYWQTPEAVARAARKFRKGDDKEFFDERTGEIIHFMDLQEIASAISQFVVRHNDRPSNGFGMDGKSPNQLWDELTALNPPRRAPVEKIAFHFMEGKPKKVRASGYIEFKKDFFFTSETLLRNSGRNVHIRWNPIDGFWWERGDKLQYEFLPNNIFVYDENGEYMTTAMFVHRQHPTETPKEIITALMQGKMSLIKEASENVNSRSDTSTPVPVPVVDVKTEPTEILRQKEEKQKEQRDKEKDPLKNNRFGESAFGNI
jgi:hypothetical protein